MTNLPNHPGFDTSDRILQCSVNIAEYILEQISTHHFEHDNRSCSFQISVPLSLNSLLSDIFDPQWSEHSKIRIFDLLRSSFKQYAYDEFAGKIEQRINTDIFPSEYHDKETNKIRTIDRYFVVDKVEIYDEPFVEFDVTTKIGDTIVTEESLDTDNSSITVEINVTDSKQDFSVKERIIE